MNEFVDLHQHLMFGIDDGPASFGETKAMIAAACADGITHIVATPHVYPGRDCFFLSGYLEKLGRITAYCEDNALPLTVSPGAEILYNDAALRMLTDGLIPSLAGGRHVLIEFFPETAYETLFQAARALSNTGYIPVIAHVERYDCLMRDTERVCELKALLPVRLQVNCSTIVRPQRFSVRRFVGRLLNDRLIDYVATDAHNTGVRPVCMRACYQKLEAKYGHEYANQLTGLNQSELFPIKTRSK